MFGDFSISGGCSDWDCVPKLKPDANFSSLPFDFSEYWVGVAIPNFEAHFDLDIVLTPSEPDIEITIPLLGDEGLRLPLEVCQTLLIILSMKVIRLPSISSVYLTSSGPSTP